MGNYFNKLSWTFLSEAPGQTESDSQSMSGQLKSPANIICFELLEFVSLFRIFLA